MKMGVKVTVIRVDRPLWMTATNLWINCVLVVMIIAAARLPPHGLLWQLGSGAVIGVLVAMLVKKQWHYYPEVQTVMDECLEIQEHEDYSVKTKLTKITKIHGEDT
jgi:hypothetical protein